MNSNAWVIIFLFIQFTLGGSVIPGQLEFFMRYKTLELTRKLGQKCDNDTVCYLQLDVCLISLDEESHCNIYPTRKLNLNATMKEEQFSVPWNFTLTPILLHARGMSKNDSASPEILFHNAFRINAGQLTEGTENYFAPILLDNTSGFLTLTVKKVCGPHHYGRDCRFCQRKDVKTYCDLEGRLRCKEGEICEKDPCAQYECLNNGSCIVVGEHNNLATCECPNGWIGEFCEKAGSNSSNISDLAAQSEFGLNANDTTSSNTSEEQIPNPRTPVPLMAHPIASTATQDKAAKLSGLDIVELTPGSSWASGGSSFGACEREKTISDPVCVNGGHCVDLNNGTDFECFCLDGWQGRYCQESIWQVNGLVGGLIALLLAIFICIIILLVCCCKKDSPIKRKFDAMRKLSSSNERDLPPSNVAIMDGTSDIEELSNEVFNLPEEEPVSPEPYVTFSDLSRRLDE